MNVKLFFHSLEVDLTMISFLRQRKIKMIWEISLRDKNSYLIGTTHMFGYRFTSSLKKLINSSDRVVLECSLEPETFNRILLAGTGISKTSIYELIDKKMIDKLAESFVNVTFKGNLFDTGDLTIGILKRAYFEDIERILKSRSHWAAFFTLWYDFLELIDWKYSMDLEAQILAKQMNKELIFLEKPDEQIEAMEGIPPERIINFLKEASNWEDYTEKYAKLYLKGKLHELMATTSIFPTRCESIIDKRDPVLFERMLPYIEMGNSSIFVGVTHIPGLIGLIEMEGLKISSHCREKFS